jgi:hypothetical protein
MLLVMAGLLWLGRAYPLRDNNWGAMARNAFWRALLATSMLAGLLWLARRQRPDAVRRVLQVALLALLPLDAFTHNPGLVPTASASTVVPGVWKLSGKASPPRVGEGRIMTSPIGEQPSRFNDAHGFELFYTSQRAAEAQSMNLLDDVPKVSGALTLRPAYTERLLEEVYRDLEPRWGKGLLDFLSVVWSSSPQDPVVWVPRTNYLPIISAGQRPVFTTDKGALQAILAKDFDPRQLVYLEESVRSRMMVTNRTPCKVLRSRVTAHHMEAEIEAAEPSLVVVSQSFYHVWRASVDGQAVPLLRANLAFQALQVPAGRHRMTLQYRDVYFRIGAIISLISLVVCGLIYAVTGATTKRPQQREAAPGRA